MPIIDAMKKSMNPKMRRFVHLGAQLVVDPFRRHYKCPVCGYRGPFMDANFLRRIYGSTQTDAICPGCDSYERHRLQRLVFEELAKTMDFSNKKMLHVAPEECNMAFFRNLFEQYTTTDLYRKNVHIELDLTKIDLPDASYDVVLATHVLEHIEEDIAAISEIRRILKPGGLAILPVPILTVRTVEYQKPNWSEFGHVRASGIDYFDRYKAHFKSVKIYDSANFPEEYQLYFIQDRTHWPSEACPRLKPMSGKKHMDYVPVCFT